MSSIQVQALGPRDAERYQHLRLRSLRESPEAFGTTYDEDLALPIEVVAERLRAVRAPVGRVVVGGFVDDVLVGTAGCMQEHKRKSRHKAVIWGLYVAPEARGRGIGRRLLEYLVREAHAWADVDRLRVTVIERAHAARRLYAAMGFEPFGVEPDAFRQGDVRDTAIYLTRTIERATARDGPPVVSRRESGSARKLVMQAESDGGRLRGELSKGWTDGCAP
ncbi:MAG: GNAT family N-acetyltransferase, partial [Gemmatimonadaceae bacterium]|nr:GNAT family N-acetyltransferase [Gemmatimonadaceae bacterium]